VKGVIEKGLKGGSGGISEGKTFKGKYSCELKIFFGYETERALWEVNS
jgi:hypothetical protein